MPMLVAGLLLLWLSSYLLRGFAKANPAGMARLLRRVGGGLALGLALLMLMRGELNLALVAGSVGLWMLGSAPGRFSVPRGMRMPGGGWRRRVGVRSASLDMVLDRSTRRLSGAFHGGPYAGRRLDGMAWAESLAAYQWCCRADPQGARMLEAYLDGRFAGWRDAADLAGDAGAAQAGRRGGSPAGMSDHEAYDVLGLAQGASSEEIARAHRRLMKQYHPDHGGSTDTAARVNQAKDALMRRHPRTRYTQ